MRTYFRLLLIITSVSVLASCSSFVKQQLLYPDSNTVQISGITHSQLLAMHNLEKSMLGEPSRLSYYLGDVSSLSDDFIPPTLNMTFRYTNAPANIEPVRKYNLELNSSELPTSKAKGVVVILHSYSANAQSVLFDSTALQVHGYHTAILELLGHGEYHHSPISFGPADVERLHQLIQALKRRFELPVILYGKSYGASIAAQYIARYGSVSRFIAVAPMTRFTPAAMRASKVFNPFLTTFVSDRWLEKTFEQVLTKSNTSSDRLSTPQILASIPAQQLPPTLILSGGLDKVSNRSEIAAIAETDNISVVDIHNRGHIEMMIYDNKLNEIIVNWLGGNKSSGQNMPLDTLTTHKND